MVQVTFLYQSKGNENSVGVALLPGMTRADETTWLLLKGARSPEAI